jgi:serine/threonine-protein kinase RsbW
MSQPESRVLETTTGAHTLEEIDAILGQAWADHRHVPDAVRMQVGIATGEIGANIVEHAAQGRAVWMRMEVRVSPHEVWVEFADAGIPATVDLASVELPDAMAERGRGLALAQSALGKLSYHRTTVNHWTLISKPFD